MVIGVTSAVWMFVIYSSINNRVLARIAGCVFVVLLYVAIGAHFIAFCLLVVLYELKNHRAYLYSVVLLIITMSAPLLMADYYCLTAKRAFFYPIIDGYMMQMHFSFLATEAAILIAVFLGGTKIKQWAAASIVIVVTIAGLLLSCSMKQESVLAAACESYFGHNDKVAGMQSNERYKTYIGAYYKNLAYAQQGKLPDELMNHYQPAYHGLFLNINENVGYMQAMFSTDALVECGDMAQAQHSAMLAMTFTPHQRSSRMLRKLIDISMINGDYDLAEKFASQLEHTIFHGQWARERVKVRENGKRAFLSQQDILFSPNDWYASLENLIESNPANKTAIDYLLCFDLLDKNLGRFKIDYDKYYVPVFGSTPAKIYQEALMMCLDKEESAKDMIYVYNVSDKVCNECIDFLARYEESNGNGLPLKEKFGKTYWFYYYYAQIKK